jgi:Family of unknown function (DUF5330)
MFFLLRMAFWLSIVVILLPTGQSQPPAAGAQFSAADAVSAAGAAVSDLRHFCTRQPEACAVGGQAAVAFGHKAQASAKMLYEFLSKQLGPTDKAATDATATGSIRGSNGAAVPLPLARPGRSHGTLTPADLAPTWRGPSPQRAG